MGKHRILTLVVAFLLVLSTPSFFTPVHAGPLNSFASSPIPYWDDDSLDTDITWSSTLQTIEIENTDGNETDYNEDFAVITDWTEAECEGNDEFSTDGTRANFTSEYDAGSVYDRVYTDSPSFTTQLDLLYVRFHKELWDLGASYIENIFIHIYDEDARAGNKAYKQLSRSVNTEDIDVLLSTFADYDTLTAVECVEFQLRAASGATFFMLLDYLWIGRDTGDLDLGIPINRQNIQEINLFVNATDLDSEVKLELYNGVTASGTYCKFNASYVTFISDGFLDSECAIDDGLARISFDIYNEIKYAEITVGHSNFTTADWWRDEYLPSGNNWLRFIDSVFDGSFTLFYLNGDTNYTSKITPEWTKTGTHDPAVDQHIFGMNVSTTDDQLAHDLTYSSELPYLGFLRTEIFIGWDLTIAAASFWSWDLSIEVDDVTVSFGYNFTESDDFEYTSVSVVKGTVDKVRIERLRTSNAAGVCHAKVMFWRTQEDHIGIMMWGEYTADGATPENFWTGGWQWTPDSGWGEVTGQNETIWISDFSVVDWTDTNVTLGYCIDSDSASDDYSISFQYNYFEYGYFMPNGVVQPHFSSTWWDSTQPGDGAIGPWSDIDNDDWDGYHEGMPESPDTPGIVIKPWWEILLEGFHTLVTLSADAITAGFVGLGSMFVNAILSGLNMFAAGATILMNALWPGSGTTVSGFFSGIAGTFGAIGSVILMFFNFIAYIASWISWGVSWFTTNILTDQGIFLICGGLILPPLMAASGQNIMGKGTGLEGVAAWFLLYASIGIKILSAAWNVIISIINTVANFIPFT